MHWCVVAINSESGVQFLPGQKHCVKQTVHFPLQLLLRIIFFLIQLKNMLKLGSLQASTFALDLLVTLDALGNI